MKYPAVKPIAAATTTIRKIAPASPGHWLHAARPPMSAPISSPFIPSVNESSPAYSTDLVTPTVMSAMGGKRTLRFGAKAVAVFRTNEWPHVEVAFLP